MMDNTLSGASIGPDRGSLTLGERWTAVTGLGNIPYTLTFFYGTLSIFPTLDPNLPGFESPWLSDSDLLHEAIT